jgi:diacylglycerol kinase (ATP)
MSKALRALRYSIVHLAQATTYSLRGLASAARHEEAFRQELLVLVLIVPFGCWAADTVMERLLLAGSWVLVLIVELLNTALELMVDKVSPEWNEAAGRAKNMGSAAVFCAVMFSCVVWGLILLPKIQRAWS